MSAPYTFKKYVPPRQPPCTDYLCKKQVTMFVRIDEQYLPFCEEHTQSYVQKNNQYFLDVQTIKDEN